MLDMQLTKRSLVFCLLMIGGGLFLSSFIGYDTRKDTPGVIEFIGDAGSPNVFTFNKWEFTRSEVPNDDFTQVKVDLTINTSSLDCAWSDLKKSIRKKKDYFYVKKFPEATVQIDGATLQDDGSYKTDAMLSLKGVTKPVALTFTVSEDKPYVIKGSGVIERDNFKFTGDGPKNEVPVNFEVTLPL